MHIASTIAATVIGFVLGSVLTQDLSGAIALIVACAGLFAGAARYAATLMRRSKEEIDLATAYGFFFGAALGCFIVLLDLLV